jgi:hypothetical protein
MPYNGVGGFDPLPPPTYPAVAGDTIRAAYFNAVIDDIRAGLALTLVRDGQAPITGNVDLTNHKFTNALNATANQEFTTLSQTVAAYLSRTVDVWVSDSSGANRLFFASSASTSYRGYSAIPHRFIGNSGTLIANTNDDGRLTAGADATAPADVTRLGQVNAAIAVGVTTATTNATTAATNNATAAAAAAALGGTSQSYQDVFASRAAGVTYTNSTGRPIVVIATGVSSGGSPQQGSLTGSVNSAIIYYTSPFSNAGNYEHTISFIVPIGATYSVALANLALSRWTELR